MDIKKVSLPMTAYPRYAYTATTVTRIYKRFNYLRNKCGLQEIKRYLPPKYDGPDVYIVRSKAARIHFDESCIQLERLQGKHVDVLQPTFSTINEFRQETIDDTNEKVLVVVTEDFGQDLLKELIEKFAWHTVVVCPSKELAADVTKTLPRINELNVPVVDVNAKDSVAQAIDGILERVVFRNMNELLDALGSIKTVNKTPLIEVKVNVKLNEFVKGFLGRGSKTIDGLLKEIQDKLEEIVQKGETTDAKVEIEKAIKEIKRNENVKKLYNEDLKLFFLLVHSVAVDVSRKLEQFVHGSYRELPDKIKELMPESLRVGTISDPIQPGVINLLIERFPKVLLDDVEEKTEIKLFLDAIRPVRDKLVVHLVEMVGKIPIVKDVDRKLQNVKSMYDESFHRLTWEIKGMFYRSKVPQNEKPLSDNEGKQLSPKVAKRMFERVKPVIGTGYRCDKLQIYVREKSDTDMARVDADIQDVLKEFHITEFTVVKSKGPVTHFRRVGDKIKAARRGTLGGFAWMDVGRSHIETVYSRSDRTEGQVYTLASIKSMERTSNESTGTKRKEKVDRRSDQAEKQLCALISKHVVNGTSEIYWISEETDQNEIRIGSIIHAEDAHEEQRQVPSIDVAAAKILMNELQNCDTRFRNSRGDPSSSWLYNDFDNSRYLDGLPVHFNGASTRCGHGTITSSLSFARDVNEGEPERFIDIRYIVIEDIEPIEEHDNRFCTMGDSGAIVCADSPDGDGVDVISMLIGSLNYNETRDNLDNIGKYLTFRMVDGLNKLREETSHTFELCCE